MVERLADALPKRLTTGYLQRMAHIISAAVRGLAGRSETVSIEFDRYQNILWGRNGSGKTTLLRVLHSALWADASLIANSPVFDATVVIRSDEIGQTLTRRLVPMGEPLTAKDRAKIKGRARAAAYQGDLDSDFPDESTAGAAGEFAWITEYSEEPISHRERLRHSYLSISRLIDDPSTYRRPYTRADGIDESTLDAMFAQQVNDRWLRYQRNSLARIRDIQQQGLGRVLSVLFGGIEGTDITESSSTDSDHAFELTKAFLRSQNIGVNFNKAQFRERYLSERTLQEVVDHIQSVTEQVEEALRPQGEFQRLLRELYSGDKELVLGPNQMRIRAGDSYIPLRALSSGERQLLNILLQALSGDTSSVIIDEPEISMHVDWQEQLVASMRLLNPDCQLIFATHSPDVMANVDQEFIRQI